MKFYLNFLVSVRPRQNEDTLWRQYVARPWENAAVLLRDTQIQEMFLKVFRNHFCVQDAKFVSAANVARVPKRVRLASTTCPRFCSALNRNTAAFRIVGKLPRVTGPSQGPGDEYWPTEMTSNTSFRGETHLQFPTKTSQASPGFLRSIASPTGTSQMKRGSDWWSPGRWSSTFPAAEKAIQEHATMCFHWGWGLGTFGPFELSPDLLLESQQPLQTVCCQLTKIANGNLYTVFSGKKLLQGV